LSYLLIPFATFIVAVIAALTHESVVIGVTVAGAAVALCVPVVFGWQLIADLDNAQRASLS
jgi:hypothetical protein